TSSPLRKLLSEAASRPRTPSRSVPSSSASRSPPVNSSRISQAYSADRRSKRGVCHFGQVSSASATHDSIQNTQYSVPPITRSTYRPPYGSPRQQRTDGRRQRGHTACRSQTRGRSSARFRWHRQYTSRLPAD